MVNCMGLALEHAGWRIVALILWHRRWRILSDGWRCQHGRNGGSSDTFEHGYPLGLPKILARDDWQLNTVRWAGRAYVSPPTRTNKGRATLGH
jgi:hypothetical protein